jgi:KaiC/GvpD/RAD55 family RecA-like ATPase
MNIELIGLRTGEGKTLSAMKKAYDMASNGVNTLIISTEMIYEDIIRRYKEQLEITEFNGIPLYLISTGSADIEVIYKMSRDKIIKNNIKYIIFDHIPASKKQEDIFNRYMNILNNLHEEFGIDILAYYQKSMNE